MGDDPDDPLQHDFAALSALERRYAGSEQERQMLDRVRERLLTPAGGASDDSAPPEAGGADAMPVRVEGFVAHTRPLVVLGLHGAFVLVAGLVGYVWPQIGALACLLATVSLVGEGTGQAGLLRLWLGRRPSYNLVVPPEAFVEAGPERTAAGTVVLVTPLDVPEHRLRWARRPRRPLLGVLLSALVLTALLILRSLSEPWGTPLLAMYTGSLAVMGVTALLVFLTRREASGTPADPGALAAQLELVRRLRAQPLEGVDVWVVFTGSGRAFQDGARAFLGLRGERLPRPALVLSLLEVGRPPLRAASTEGPLWPQHHRPTGPALVERLRWAGVRVPEVDLPEPTDARAATNLGYRAVSLVGGEGAPTPDAARRAADVAELVVRWFADDLRRIGPVADDLPVAVRRRARAR